MLARDVAASGYRVVDRQLSREAGELALGRLLADTYLDADVIVERAARSSSHLITLDVRSGTPAFAFVALHAMRRGRTAMQIVLHGGMFSGLLGALAEHFPRRDAALAWTLTAQPIVTSAWRKHFGVREVLPRDGQGEEIARELWKRLGVRQPSDPGIARGAFPYEYTPAELARIARANALLPEHGQELDADLGDRRLLLARR